MSLSAAKFQLHLVNARRKTAERDAAHLRPVPDPPAKSVRRLEIEWAERYYANRQISDAEHRRLVLATFRLRGWKF